MVRWKKSRCTVSSTLIAGLCCLHNCPHNEEPLPSDGSYRHSPADRHRPPRVSLSSRRPTHSLAIRSASSSSLASLVPMPQSSSRWWRVAINYLYCCEAVDPTRTREGRVGPPRCPRCVLALVYGASSFDHPRTPSASGFLLGREPVHPLLCLTAAARRRAHLKKLKQEEGEKKFLMMR